MKEQVIEILMDQLDLDRDEVTDDASFIDDFEMDSLDMMEMVIEIEKATGLKVDNEKLADLKTVGDVTTYLEGLK